MVPFLDPYYNTAPNIQGTQRFRDLGFMDLGFRGLGFRAFKAEGAGYLHG